MAPCKLASSLPGSRILGVAAMAASLWCVRCGADPATQPVAEPGVPEAASLTHAVAAGPSDSGVGATASASLDLYEKLGFADSPELRLTAIHPRDEAKASLVRSNMYDYAPTVMFDGVYRMWWCGGIAGDHVLYAEASALSGPWHARGSNVANSFNDVFSPRMGDANAFDNIHTCDPSVVRADNGTYYLYYGALSKVPNAGTQLGVASSPDGLSWTRLNGGKPIFKPVRSPLAVRNRYGAGQPSAIYKDDKFYLIYTDSTGYANNPANGSGQYVVRSADPTFQSGVEELGANGFAPMSAANHTRYTPFASFSVDWQYADAFDGFIIASNNGGGKTFLLLFDANLKPLNHGQAIEVPGDWTEGPGLVSLPNKHAIPGNRCYVVPVDLMRSKRDGTGVEGANGWDLFHNGISIAFNRTCKQVRLEKVYQGSRVAASAAPLGVVLGNRLFATAMATPATLVARNQFALDRDLYNQLPFGGTIARSNRVIAATGRPAAFITPDTNLLMPINCMEVVYGTSSAIEMVSSSVYARYRVGPQWICLR
ncbi:MAG: hypothetical protein EOO40_04610 [Deltaproteobacteria bacterium]|nr:MAG: hypothetical protein EOO40_04610 [Deltaproteobacteria bacterium]